MGMTTMIVWRMRVSWVEGETTPEPLDVVSIVVIIFGRNIVAIPVQGPFNCVYIYIHIYNMYTYIYIYIERERDREHNNTNANRLHN